MPRQEHILSVFVASPSDVSDERTRLEEVITELNQSWSRSLGIRLDLIRWETHAYPGFGVDPQDVINRQIPADYDIFIGIMWHRFGTATERADSGTEEEFMRAKTKWEADHSAVDLMIYFKDAPVAPSKLDASQLSKVNAFRNSLGKEGGLYWSFQSTDDFVNLVRIHLTRVVQVWQGKLAGAAGESNPEATNTSLGPRTEAVDDEEAGLIELSEEFEDNFEEANDVLTRIAKATDSMGKKMQEHARRVQAATGTGSMTRSAAKRLVARASKDMSDYAGKLNQEIPVLRNLLESGLGAFSKALSLLPDFVHEQSNRDQATEWVTSIQTLRNVLSSVEGNVQAFLDSVNGLPRLSTDLNKAKRSVRRELENLIDLFRSQQQLLAQTQTAAASLVTRQENT